MDPAALQAWDGALVNCTGDAMCAEMSGGRTSWLVVSCSWMAGLPDGFADGRYCRCSEFRVGATCHDVQPALQVRGALTASVAVLAGLAAWRGICDLRQCPRELRRSPGAVCLAVNVCATSALMICMSLLGVTRMTGGSAALSEVATASFGVTFCLSYAMFLVMALVFETVTSATEQRAMNHTRWYCGATFLLTAQVAGIATFKIRTHLLLCVAIGLLIVVLLWLRATVMLARGLDGFSSYSAAIAEKALATRQLIRFTARGFGLIVACQAENVMVPITANSHPALIAATWFLDWVFSVALVALLVRFQGYLGAPLRQASQRQSKRRILSAAVCPAGSRNISERSASGLKSAKVDASHSGGGGVDIVVSASARSSVQPTADTAFGASREAPREAMGKS
jgi:hypothetical protein